MVKQVWHETGGMDSMGELGELFHASIIPNIECL